MADDPTNPTQPPAPAGSGIPLPPLEPEQQENKPSDAAPAPAAAAPAPEPAPAPAPPTTAPEKPAPTTQTAPMQPPVSTAEPITPSAPQPPPFTAAPTPTPTPAAPTPAPAPAAPAPAPAAPAPAPAAPAPAAAPTLQAPTVPTPATVPQQQTVIEKPLLPCVLIVLDGWGVAPPSRGNAIAMAKTPNMNNLMAQYPTMTLHASGEVVGLPWGEMGNSEVGHLNLGAGKIIYQYLPLINKSISDGTFFKNKVLLEAISEVKKSGKKLHLMGLVSDGGIHSSQDHLYALLELCRDQGMDGNTFIHAILDGRDTGKNDALGFIAKLETKMQETGVGKIATLSGRHFTMDRDNRWERIQAAYDAIRFGKSDHVSDSPLKAIEQSYERNIFDEQFPPTVIMDAENKPIATVDDADVMIFFNFRADRARQITKAFVMPGFEKFDRGEPVNDLMFVCMTEFEKNLPVRVAFEPEQVEHPVARVVSDGGYAQLHIAETEKYAHVTFFFNGGTEEQYPNEDRVLIPSQRVKSYDETPAMSVMEIAKRMVEEIQANKYQFIVANFANPDMVGHTGDLQAAIQAVEATDVAIGQVAEAVLAAGGTLVITADHGNAEEMLNLQTGSIIKEHSTNPVPCIICNSKTAQQRMMWPPVHEGDLSRLQPIGVLSDIAPTLLTLMGLPIPEDMTSRSLIR